MKRARRAKLSAAGPLPDNWNVVTFPSGGVTALDGNQCVRASLILMERGYTSGWNSMHLLFEGDADICAAMTMVHVGIERLRGRT